MSQIPIEKQVFDKTTYSKVIDTQGDSLAAENAGVEYRPGGKGTI
jgi:hypothetical protein